MKKISKKVALTGVLAALALAFSLLEGFLPPLPMLPPGAKLGLSNIVTMYAVESLGSAAAVFISLIKGAFVFLTRGAMAGAMSLSGGIFSTVVMLLLVKKTAASFSVLGVCGALSHNLAQLCVAYFLMRTAVLFYLPFMIFFGVITGFLTGLVLKITLPPLRKLEKYWQ